MVLEVFLLSQYLWVTLLHFQPESLLGDEGSSWKEAMFFKMLRGIEFVKQQAYPQAMDVMA